MLLYGDRYKGHDQTALITDEEPQPTGMIRGAYQPYYFQRQLQVILPSHYTKAKHCYFWAMHEHVHACASDLCLGSLVYHQA